MIDRIKFYIKDVDSDFIIERLELYPYGVAKDESVNHAGHIKNLKVFYSGTTLRIEGSLHKYAHGNNYDRFTYEEAKNVIVELSETIGVSLERFVVSQIELGVNLQMDKEPKRYIDIIHSYQHTEFIPMSPLKGTSKLMGCRCKLSEYELKFYNKTFEYLRSEKSTIPKADDRLDNILRFEVVLSRNNMKYNGFKNVTGRNLLSPLHYSKFKRLLKRLFEKIVMTELSFNHEKVLQDDVKNYIFATSKAHNKYLQYLKEVHGEKEYRKEMRRKNILIKKIQPFLTGELESELKEKFAVGLSKI